VKSRDLVDSIFEKRKPEVELQRLIGLEDKAHREGSPAKAAEMAKKIKAHAKKHGLRVIKPD
jgi:hypothetical protein